MKFTTNQPVNYRGESYVVLSQQSSNWVRITNRHAGEHGFVVPAAALTAREVIEQPQALKNLSPSVEKARSVVRLAFDYKSLYFAVRKSGYLQNDLRSWMAEQNRRQQNFGLMKAMLISKLAKIIRSQETH